jgi:hypothetical protein
MFLLSYYQMLQQNLASAGPTRGERLVVRAGQRKAPVIVIKGRRAQWWSEPRDWHALITGSPPLCSGVTTLGGVRRKPAR